MVLPEHRETVEGKVIETYHYPAGMLEQPLPREIREANPGLREGEYKLVYVHEGSEK